MKKAILYIVVVLIVIAAITAIHYVNQSAQPPEQLSESASAEPVKFDVPVGEMITFQLKYRGISGKDDDLRAYGGYGFGGSDSANASPFMTAVAEQTDNQIFAAYTPYLKLRQFSAVEYKDRDIIALYFDTDGDGKLSEEEKFKPAEVSRENRRGDDTTVFLTPDFMVTAEDGQKVPFRVIVWVDFYRDSPNVTWWPMGVYEGDFKLDGEKMKLYLFPDFNTKNYAAFGRSNYALVSAKRDNNGYMPRSSLSSLIVKDKTYYRLAVQPAADSQTVFVTLAEDKSPRGKIAYDVQANEKVECNVNNVTLRGAAGSKINFTINRDMHEVPTGEYKISSGYMLYGPDGAYSTSFSNVPKFAVKTGKTTTIAIGKPKPEIRAVEKEKRYSNDKEYKSEFPEDTPVYIDVVFAGVSGETYRGFRQRVQKEKYTTTEYIKAQLTIADGAGSTVISKELEPG